MRGVFSPDVVRRANEKWARSTSILWTPIEALAANLRAVSSGQDDPRLTRNAWAALLMAVGNFKRQAPIRIDWEPVAPGSRISPQLTKPSSIPWPFAAGSASIDEEGAQTWELIDKLQGVGTATATTMLAALWPRSHAVFDVRAHNAAVGLSIALNGQIPPHATGVTLDDAESLVQNWDAYGWYRGRLTDWSDGKDLSRIERTLFELDQALSDWTTEWTSDTGNTPVIRNKKKMVPWGAYAGEVLARTNRGWPGLE